MIKKITAILLGVLLSVGVGLTADLERTLTFEWDQVISDDFAKWTLYKSNSSGGPYEFVTDIPYSPDMTEPYTTSEVLVVADGATTTMYFVLTASDSLGNTSEYSNEAVHTFDFEPPAEPIQFRINVVTQ